MLNKNIPLTIMTDSLSLFGGLKKLWGYQETFDDGSWKNKEFIS